MSVFKIQQISKEAPKPVITPAGSDVDAEKGKETTLEPGTGPTDTPATEPITHVDVESGASATIKKDVMLKIDGPVGRLFTEALNKALATESYMTMLPAMGDQPEAHDPVTDLEPDLQVYCWTGDSLEASDVIEITNDIAKHQNREYVVSVEAIRQTPRAMAALQALRSDRVKLCYSRESAVAEVKARLQR